MIEKIDIRSKWKNKNTVEENSMYRKLNSELRRKTDKAVEKWLQE